MEDSDRSYAEQSPQMLLIESPFGTAPRPIQIEYRLLSSPNLRLDAPVGITTIFAFGPPVRRTNSSTTSFDVPPPSTTRIPFAGPDERWARAEATAKTRRGAARKRP
jgi:hypothetical protein